MTWLRVTHLRHQIRISIYHDRKTYGNNSDMLTLALNQNLSLCWFYFCLILFIRHNHIWRKIKMKAPMRIHLYVESIYVWLVCSYMNKPLLPYQNILFYWSHPELNQNSYLVWMNYWLTDWPMGWMTNLVSDISTTTNPLLIKYWMKHHNQPLRKDLEHNIQYTRSSFYSAWLSCVPPPRVVPHYQFSVILMWQVHAITTISNKLEHASEGQMTALDGWFF